MIKKILSNNVYFWSLIIVIFCISRLATWFFPFDSDHWIFYYMGKIWAQGGSLYVAAFDHKPPIIYLINAFMYLCFNDNLIWHRIFFTLWSVGGAYLFYLISGRIFRTIFSKNSIYLTRLSLLLYVFWTNLSQFTNSGNNTENFGIVFLLLMIWLYIKFRDTKKSWFLLISGIFFALLFWLKPNMIILSLPIWIDMIFFDKTSTNYFFTNITNKIKQILIFIAPWIALSIYWYIYFHSHGSYADFMLASFYFSSKYMASAWEGHVSAQNIFIVILIGFLVPFLAFIAVYLKNSIRLWRIQFTHRLLTLWILSALLYIAISGSFYTYYYLIIMPILVLGMVASIDYFATKKWLRIFSILFILAMLLSLAISYKQFYNAFWGSVRATEINDREVAEYVEENSTPNDKILSYTYGATFYELAHRDTGARYLSASHLLLDEREGFGFNITDNYIKDAETSKPIYLIYPNEDNDRYDLYIQDKKAVDYLMSHYKLEKVFDEYSVYRRTN